MSSIRIHPSWLAALQSEFDAPYWQELTTFVKAEYATHICFPAWKDIFRAFDKTPFDAVRVVILGQDPYHTPGAAMWLSFSVPDGSRPQPSLRNIFEEIQLDIGMKRASTDLSDWAEQGILLLNSVLTVRQWEPASHQGKWWERFTDSVISQISQQKEGVVFILWWAYAISKSSLIDIEKHHIISSPHPSPFSAYKGFFGSRPFSKTNAYLRKMHTPEIIWVK